jgi:ABC-2 type transport system permease protein
MIGTTIFSLVYGFLHTIIVLIVIVVVFDLQMDNANYFSASLVLVAGSLSLVGIGIMGAVLPLLFPEKGDQMAHVIQAVLVLISGVYAVPSSMPEPLETLSIFSPATYVLEGIRGALIDGESVADLWPTMLGLVVTGLFLIPVGVRVFSMGERYAKRTGKLKRSG